MPWRNPCDVPFTRIGIVASIPSDGGVFAILAGDNPLLISESWNLKARLLELINNVPAPENFTVRYELCAEQELAARRQTIEAALLERRNEAAKGDFPGISLWALPTAGEPALAESVKS